MDIQAEKIELVKMLLNTNDEVIIKKVRALFKKSEGDFWETLPADVKKGIEKSRQQAKDGQLISFEQFSSDIKNF